MQKLNETAKIKRSRFGVRKFLLTVSTLISLVLIFRVGFDFYTKYYRHEEILRLRAENQKLTRQFELANNKLDRFEKELKEIQVRENELRVAASLPTVWNKESAETEFLDFYDYEEMNVADYTTFSEDVVHKLSSFESELKNTQKEYEKIISTLEQNIQIVRGIPTANPVPRGRLTDKFGRRFDPFTSKIRKHNGVDLAAPKRTPVYATADGVVKFSGRNGGYGKFVRIKHDFGYQTAYGHLYVSKVRRGQKVKKGDLIGLVGNSGRSTGYHLHYEIKHNGTFVDPLDYFYLNSSLENY